MTAYPDEIRLTGLQVFGYHGVFDVERREGQHFGLDVTLGVDVSEAAAGDDLTKTVDYGDLATRVAAVVEGEPVDLIETLASRIAEVALTYDRVGYVEVTVHKPSAPIPLQFADVAVVVRRSRADR